MKSYTKEQFDEMAPGGVNGSEATKLANAILRNFIGSGAEVAEIEASDFNGLFDFDETRDRTKARRILVNKVGTCDFRPYKIWVRGKDGKLFIGRSIA